MFELTKKSYRERINRYVANNIALTESQRMYDEQRLWEGVGLVLSDEVWCDYHHAEDLVPTKVSYVLSVTRDPQQLAEAHDIVTIHYRRACEVFDHQAANRWAKLRKLITQYRRSVLQ